MLGTRAQRGDPGESVRRGRRGGDDGADRWARRGSDGEGRAANGRARGLRKGEQARFAGPGGAVLGREERGSG